MNPNAPPPPPNWNPFVPAELVSAAWATARQQHPVFLCPMLNAYVVTRHEDVATVIADPARFSSRDALYVGPVPPEFAPLLPNGYPWDTPTLVNSDPPAHARIRRLCAPAFRPAAVAAREQEMRELADHLIDGFIADGQVELISRFAEPLPGRIMCRLLNIPDADAPRFTEWVDHLTQMFNPMLPQEARVVALRGTADLYAYCEKELQRRRSGTAAPAGDFLTALMEARDTEAGGEPMLSDPELLSVLSQILLAGNETTRRAIGSLVYLLLGHPDQLAAVKRDPALLSAACEESLRHTTAAKGLFRRTTAPVELGGASLPAGALVILLWASANRDEKVFKDPEQFDILRKDVDRHLAFSRGPHFCLGASLARLLMKVALERLLTRLPNLRRDESIPVEWALSVVNQGPSRLAVRWDP